MATPPRSQQPTTVGALEQRLRRMLGHVRKKDRQTLMDAVEAIHELTTRLVTAKSRTNVPVNGNVAQALEDSRASGHSLADQNVIAVSGGSAEARAIAEALDYEPRFPRGTDRTDVSDLQVREDLMRDTYDARGEGQS